MTYSNNLFEMLSSMIGHKRSTKSKFPMGQTPVGNLDQIALNLRNFISHDLLYQYL